MPRIIWGYDPKCGSLLWWFSPCRGLRPRSRCPSPTKGVKIQSPKTEIREGLIQQCNSNTTNHNNNNNSNSDSNEQSKIATKYSSLKHDVQNHECTALRARKMWPARMWRPHGIWITRLELPPTLLGKLNPILLKPGHSQTSWAIPKWQ